MNKDRKNNKIFFCSFSDSRFTPNLKRIEKEAKTLETFDNIFIYNEKSLDREFVEQFKDKLRFKVRGYGFWVWKPYLILKTIQKLEEGDVLLYADTGCKLNSSAKVKLNEYIDRVRISKSGILASQLLPFHNEKIYTKADLLEFFEVTNKTEILDTPQIAATFMFIRKCDNSIRILKQWLSVFYENFKLIDDTPSIVSNDLNFVEHRHDQSVFSILYKLNEIDLIEFEEVSNKKEVLQQYPIWTIRIKKRSFKGCAWWLYSKIIN